MMVESRTVVVVAVGVCLLAMMGGASASGGGSFSRSLKTACLSDVYCKDCRWGHCQSCFSGYKLWYGECVRKRCARCTSNCFSCDCGKCWSCKHGYDLRNGFCRRTLGHRFTRSDSDSCRGHNCSSHSSSSGSGGFATSYGSASGSGSTHTVTRVSDSGVYASAYSSSHSG